MYIVYTFLISCHFSRKTEAFFLVKPFTTSNQVQSERPSVRLRTWRCEVSPVLADDFRPKLLSLILTFSAPENSNSIGRWISFWGWPICRCELLVSGSVEQMICAPCRLWDHLCPFKAYTFHQSLRGMVFEHKMGLNLLLIFARYEYINEILILKTNGLTVIHVSKLTVLGPKKISCFPIFPCECFRGDQIRSSTHW